MNANLLTNNQRKCFGLSLIKDDWEQIEIKSSPHDSIKTYAYIDGTTIVKCIKVGIDEYMEYTLNEEISEDYTVLYKKTSTGKDVKLSSSTLEKRMQLGMVLSYYKGYITLYSQENKKDYYNSAHEDNVIKDMNDFLTWASNWEQETTLEDIKDINLFLSDKTKHIKYSEGDIFCFKINRREYGYGKIMLDYNKMRKEKKPFWDILMGTALVASVFHIITTNPNLKVEDVEKLKSLPSLVIADNVFYYNEYKIIGNTSLSEDEDYPIMYGRSISALDKKTTMFQRGKEYIRMNHTEPLYPIFTNNGVSFRFNFTISMLRECITSNSNDPYWQADKWYMKKDLRNPLFKKELKEILKQCKR